MRATRLLLLTICLGATIAARPDRRIVDRVTIGDLRSEQEHAYAGENVTTGASQGRTFRQTRSWMRYALTVFDDTEVTIGCTFLGSDTPGTFDLIVENRVVSTHTFRSTETRT
ncbi:MAG: DUF6805 domain-containing protein, partial [bacterium]